MWYRRACCERACRCIECAIAPAHRLHAAQGMHEGRGRLKEYLDHSTKVGHAAQVQAHAAAHQPYGVMQQERGIPCLLIQQPGCFIHGVVHYVAIAHRAPNEMPICSARVLK